jgi:hypothetical protein
MRETALSKGIVSVLVKFPLNVVALLRVLPPQNYVLFILGVLLYRCQCHGLI